MKKLLLLVLLIVSHTSFAKLLIADSLTRAEFVHSQTIKSDSLNSLALQLAAPGASAADLNQAINLIMKGLHAYSRFRDSTGLRQTFDNLSLVYRLQKKHVQAKWFAIQSNMLARDMHDTVNIIHSLLTLSAVKTEIKDYDLAKRDLNEALQLAKQLPGIETQIDVQQGIATYYTKKGDASRAALAMNRIIFLKDSVAMQQDDQKQAVINQQKDVQQASNSLLNQKQQALNQQQAEVNMLANQKKGITIITIAVILAITVVIFWIAFKKKRKKRKSKSKKP